MPPDDQFNAVDRDQTRSAADVPERGVSSLLETREHVSPSNPSFSLSTDRTEFTPTPVEVLLPPRYTFHSRLGGGGMGEVFRAYDNELRRNVAIKFMRPAAAASPMARRRFLSEATILAQLSHPNVVDVFEKGEIDGRPYFVMAYLDGATLSERRHEFRTSAARAVRVVAEIAAAVQYAHDKGVYHRDLKALNVVFDDGRPVVTDFGCACWEDGDISTLGYAVLGTTTHMPPEVFEYGSKDRGAEADLWALGVMLFQLLAGELPFADPRTLEGRKKLLNEDPAPLRSHTTVVPGVNDHLEEIVRKALAKNLDERFQSAAEFVAALEGWAADTEYGIVVGDKQPPQMLPTFARSRLWLLLALVGAISVVLATIEWFRSTPPTIEKPITPPLHERLSKPGDFVELVGATGIPTESVREPQGVVGSTSLSQDKFFEIESARVFFLELGDQALPFPFRLRAEARLTTTSRDTKVGVYTNRKAHVQADGTFVHVAFLNGFGQMNSSQHIPRFTGQDGWGVFPARIALTNSMLAPTDGAWVPVTPDPPTADETPGPFHVVELDVYPSTWQANLDGQTARPKKRTTAVAATLAALNGLNENVTQPPFGDGFGLFVFQGGGQFRNVRIIRLAD